MTAPFALPVLPVETYIRYAKAIGVEPSTAERKELAELPQHYADMHGWHEIVATVAEVYQSLGAEEKTDVVIFAPNYGVAGAIDFLGPEYGLPSAISNHNNYWLWGPGEDDRGTAILIGVSEDAVSRLFESHERAATIECGYCMPYENHNPVWLGRDLKQPMAELWPSIKNYK